MSRGAPAASGRSPTLGEEIANAVTHGLGLIAALTGLPLLITASVRTSGRAVLGAAVFAAALVFLYAASTLYHALPASRAKRVFRAIDHAAIYALIAGTYTPFMLGALRGSVGWPLLLVVWSLAVVGIVLKCTIGFRYPVLSTAAYLVMGWLVVVAARPLAASLPAAGIAWLVAGGLSYSGGVVFFAWRRLPYSHAVWHGFVLAGSVCHYVAVLRYGIPAAG
jgi:hemolysin III